MNRFSTSTLHLEKVLDDPDSLYLAEGFLYKTHVGKSGFMDFPELELDPATGQVRAKVHPYLKDDFITPYNTLDIQPFRTDLASIPWWVGWKLKKYGVYDFAAVVHDYLLQHRDLFPELSRKQIDQIFREAIIDLGVPEKMCELLYWGVRLNSYWREERFK